MAMKLAAILSNPPLTAGVRTMNRVELARKLLHCDSVTVANLFPLATHQSGDIRSSGVDPARWLDARPSIIDSLDGASTVLLAYGVSEPSGEARLHFREQVEWLATEILNRNLIVVQFAGRPMHPSRWHRHTYRAFPGMPFEEAAEAVFA